MSYSDLPPYTDDEYALLQSNSVNVDSKLRDKTETFLPVQTSDTSLPSNLSYTRDRNSNIICAESLLEDPVYFSAFIQHHGSKPPDLKLQITGSHWEDLSQGPDTTNGNHVKNDSQRLVTDFDFGIPLTSEILIRQNKNTPPYFFTYKSDVSTFRNSTIKRRQRDADELERVEAGLSVGQHAIVQYLSSTHPLKEFRFEKVVSGWDMKLLKKQIQTIIKRTGYNGMINVNLQQRENYIYIRPASTFSHLYRHPLAFFLRCLLFPLGLLFLLADYLYLGAYWQVLGAKYDLYSYNSQTGEERGMSVDKFLIKFGDLIAVKARTGSIGETLEWDMGASSSYRAEDPYQRP